MNNYYPEKQANATLRQTQCEDQCRNSETTGPAVGGLAGSKRVPGIPSMVSLLFMATERLSERLAKFEGRLQTVLQTHPRCNETAELPSPATELGGQLQQIVSRLGLVIECVDSLDARLDL